MPSRPGILRSVSTRSKPRSSSNFAASLPSLAGTTVCSSSSSESVMNSRRPASSSATRMRAMSGLRNLGAEQRAPAGIFVHGDRAAVLLDDPARDREPEARALRLAGEKRLEDALAILLGDARSEE